METLSIVIKNYTWLWLSTMKDALFVFLKVALNKIAILTL